MSRLGSMLFSEETVTLLIAVLVIAGLLGAGVRGYQIIGEKNEQRNAQKFVDAVVGRYDLLQTGQGNSFVFQGFSGGEHWYLTGWSDADPGRPQKCFFSDCLCLCRAGASASNCQLDGFCRDIALIPSVSAVPVDIYKASGGTGGAGVYTVPGYPSCISIGHAVVSLELSKNDSHFSIYSSLKDPANVVCASER